MLTPQAESVVLLTAVLGKQGVDSPKPLSIGEWADFAQLLQSRQMRPADLLEPNGEQVVRGWQHRSITAERVGLLLGRGTALALCLERWERVGLWLLVRSDVDYPQQLKRRLVWKSPPLLFGCGNRSLLAKRGLAVVGSRRASGEDLEVAASLGRAAAANGHMVVSGGAQGVDESAMLASLGVGGTAVGVLAAGLQRAATSRKWRSALERGDLALISPFAPTAPFHAGNAMGRNRYIYCLASVAAVVASEEGAGGTWSGAVENLKHGWVPLWVHRSAAASSGNAALVERGARWVPDERTSLFNGDEPAALPASSPGAAVGQQPSQLATDASAETADLDHYGLFLRHLECWTSQSPIGWDELVRREGVRKDQLKVWLNRGKREGDVDEVDDGCFRFAVSSQPALSFDLVAAEA